MPALIVDGKLISQSTAILRYVGKLGKGDLYPKDPLEAALVDQLISMVQDVEFSLAPSGNEPDPEKKAILRKTLAAETLPKLFGYIDKFVGSRNKNFSIRDSVTVGDLFLYQMNTSYSSGVYGLIPTDVLDGFPNIAKIVAAVKSLPEVQAWENAHQ